MKEPTVIKGPLPGQAVEQYRMRHHGFLPTEELTWIDSFVTALQANLTDKCRDVEFEELKKLAIAGSYAIGQNASHIASETKAKVPPAPCSDELWEEIMDFLRDHEDVVDGSDGESLPNNAMRILQRIDNGGR